MGERIVLTGIESCPTRRRVNANSAFRCRRVSPIPIILRCTSRSLFHVRFQLSLSYPQCYGSCTESRNATAQFQGCCSDSDGHPHPKSCCKAGRSIRPSEAHVKSPVSLLTSAARRHFVESTSAQSLATGDKKETTDTATAVQTCRIKACVTVHDIVHASQLVL